MTRINVVRSATLPTSKGTCCLIGEVIVPASTNILESAEAIQIPFEEVKGEESPVLCELHSDDFRLYCKFLVPYPRLQRVTSENLDYPLNRAIKSINERVLPGGVIKIYGRTCINRTVAPELVVVLQFTHR